MSFLKNFKELFAKFRNNQSLIFLNLAWLGSGKFIRLILGFISSVLIAQYLGPSQLGKYSFALAYISIFSSISELGLKNIVIRNLVKKNDDTSILLNTTFLLLIIGNVCAFIFSIFSLSFFSITHITFWLTLLISVIFIFRPFSLIAIYYFEAITQSKYIIISSNFGLIISFSLNIILIFNNAPILYFAAPIILESLIGGILCFLFFKNQTHISISLLKYIEWDIAKRLLKDSYPLLFSSIMVVIYMQIDQIMLPILSSTKEAGLYAISVKLTEFWYFIPGIIYISVYPYFIKLYQENQKKFNIQYHLLMKVIIFTFIAISLLYFILAPYFMPFIFGEIYAESARMLSVLIWASVFVAIGQIRNIYLNILNLNVLNLYTISIGAVINLLLNLLLIPMLGGLGASISTLIAYIIASFLSCFIFSKIRPIGYFIFNSIFFKKNATYL